MTYTRLLAHYVEDVSGAVELTVQGTTHAHTANQPVLTQVHQLAVANAAHIHTADQPNLAGATNLTVQDASHSHVAGNPALTQVHILAVSAAQHVHIASDVVLALIRRIQNQVVAQCGNQSGIVGVWPTVPAKNIYLNPSLLVPVNDSNNGVQRPSQWVLGSTGPDAPVMTAGRISAATEAFRITAQAPIGATYANPRDDNVAEDNVGSEFGYEQEIQRPASWLIGDTVTASMEARCISLDNAQAAAFHVRLRLEATPSAGGLHITASTDISSIAESVVGDWVQLECPLVIPTGCNFFSTHIRGRLIPADYGNPGQPKATFEFRKLQLEKGPRTAWSPPTTTSGNLVMMSVTARTDITPPEPLFTVPSGWVRAAQATNINGETTALYYIEGSAPRGIEAVTFADGTSRDAALQLAEYSGIKAPGALDATATATGLGAAQNTGTTVTTTQADELFFGVLGTTKNATPILDNVNSLPANAYALVEGVTSANPTPDSRCRLNVFETIRAATSTAKVEQDGGSSQQWAGVIATFKAGVAVVATDLTVQPAAHAHVTDSLALSTFGQVAFTGSAPVAADAGATAVLVARGLVTASSAAASLAGDFTVTRTLAATGSIAAMAAGSLDVAPAVTRGRMYHRYIAGSTMARV